MVTGIHLQSKYFVDGIYNVSSSYIGYRSFDDILALFKNSESESGKEFEDGIKPPKSPKGGIWEDPKQIATLFMIRNNFYNIQKQ